MKKYDAIKSIEDKLRCTYHYHDDILFLADNEPESLYPYLVLKENERYNNMHLWCMSPWKTESDEKQKRYFECLHDFSKLKSLL